MKERVTIDINSHHREVRQESGFPVFCAPAFRWNLACSLRPPPREIHPDSGVTPNPLGNGTDGVYDRIEFKYNRQGEQTEKKDQNGTIHQFDYDKLGRRTHDRVTTVGTGVDDGVRRISTTYEVRGNAEKVTSHDNAVVGSGNVINEILFKYDSAGLLVKEYQEHAGAKDASTLYVQYNHDTTASGGIFTKGLRPTSVRYPNGRLVHTTYGTAGGTGDVMNRLDAINADASGSPGTAFAEYTYLGAGTIVKEDYLEPNIRLDYDSGTPGGYAGRDRFGRVVDLLWRDYGSSADAVRIKHGYDRSSNPLWREDAVAAANNVDLDELYAYDGIYQLTDLDRGDLNAGKDALLGGSLGFAEQWAFDMTGNWTTFKQNHDGNSTWDLDQSRTSNKANEIAQVDGSTSHVAHDRAGNMTKAPKPNDWAGHYGLTYDAWNRPVKVGDGMNTVAAYEYDGRRYCVLQKSYSSGTLDETRHFYYDRAWRCLEERLETGGAISGYADRQFIWRSNDAMVLRERDTSDPKNGVLDERLYFLQDTTGSTVALADPNGTVQERYAYNAFGATRVLTPTFTARTSSSYDAEFLYAGYRHDHATDLYLVRNRVYHPQLGRWLRRDPLGYFDDITLYRYVYNSPVKYVDIFGLKAGKPSALLRLNIRVDGL